MTSYFLVLFGLCLPVWVLGAMFDIQLFKGFKLFQAGLAMPMIAALLVTYRQRGKAGLAALLRRTYDAGKIKPRKWFVPILFLIPSFGFVDYCVVRLAGTDVPPPTFSVVGLSRATPSIRCKSAIARSRQASSRPRLGGLPHPGIRHQRLLLGGLDLLARRLHHRAACLVRVDLQQLRKELVLDGAVPLDFRAAVTTILC